MNRAGALRKTALYGRACKREFMAARAQVNITDRAKRYRAQNAVSGPQQCVMCGSRSDLQVMHLSGNESHGESANLAYGCRSCNGKLSAAFKALSLGVPTNQYNPAKSGIPTFEQYMWAVSNHTRKAHDEGGAIIHATPKHKRIEYARRIVAKAQRTKQERRSADDERWNPAPSKKWGRGIVLYDGDSLAQARQYLRRAVAGGAYIGLQMYGKEGAWHVTAESARSKGNPWPFSLKQAPVPASGGIAHHMAKAGKSTAAADSGTHRGYKISRTVDGEYFSSLDPQSWFETKAQAKAHVDRYLKGRTNPAGAAAGAFENFHGFAPSETVTVTKKVFHHEHLAAAGKLTHLDVWGIDGRGHHISKFKGAFLAFNEDCNQLFVEGGDQQIDLADYGIDAPHELETLGRVTDIGYQTNKTHLGDEGGEAVYIHKFRTTNDNGRHVVVKIARYPDLIYDVRNEQLLFSGGSYEILREGINK
jgi:hypothetical protein